MRARLVAALLLAALLALSVGPLSMGASSIAEEGADVNLDSAPQPSVRVRPATLTTSIADGAFLAHGMVEPEYADAADSALVETSSETHAPRILRPAQFAEYMRLVTADKQPMSSFVETSSRVDAAQRLLKCTAQLNSWLHRCVF